MKNLVGTDAALEKGYFDLADINKGEYPSEVVPTLLDKVIPLNEAIDVDFFVPGCPTPADAIYEVLKGVLEEREVDISSLTRFGK
jgi:NAD-reducing hydrogenase small subunit